MGAEQTPETFSHFRTEQSMQSKKAAMLNAITSSEHYNIKLYDY
jgi:hypothetical protein